MKEYCHSCGAFCEQDIKYRDMQIKVNDDFIWILAEGKFCRNCGADNSSVEMINKNTEIAQNAYDNLKPLWK